MHRIRPVDDSEAYAAYEPGGRFGEMAPIDDAPRSASAWAAGHVERVPVGRERFYEPVRRTPHVALQGMSIVADRSRRAMP